MASQYLRSASSAPKRNAHRQKSDNIFLLNIAIVITISTITIILLIAIVAVASRTSELVADKKCFVVSTRNGKARRVAPRRPLRFLVFPLQPVIHSEQSSFGHIDSESTVGDCESGR